MLRLFCLLACFLSVPALAVETVEEFLRRSDKELEAVRWSIDDLNVRFRLTNRNVFLEHVSYLTSASKRSFLMRPTGGGLSGPELRCFLLQVDELRKVNLANYERDPKSKGMAFRIGMISTGEFAKGQPALENFESDWEAATAGERYQVLRVLANPELQYLHLELHLKMAADRSCTIHTAAEVTAKLDGLKSDRARIATEEQKKAKEDSETLDDVLMGKSSTGL